MLILLSQPCAQPDAATFLNSGDENIKNTAEKVVKMVVAAGYDGLQMDWEGLKPTSQEGFETLVRSVSESLAGFHLPMISPVASLTRTSILPICFQQVLRSPSR